MEKGDILICSCKNSVPRSMATNVFRRSLYNDSDEALAVDEPHFYSNILGKPNAFIIEYYASWCGDCQAFAPVFKKFAVTVKEWRNVIAIAHIDCAETINVEVCRAYEIEFATKEMMGKTLFVGATNIDTVPIYKSMIDFVSQEVKSPPSSWPNMLPISHPDWVGVWNATPASTNWVAVLVETADSILGRDIILSTQHMQPYIRITRAIKGQAPFLGNTDVNCVVIAERGVAAGIKSSCLGQVREPYIKHLEELAKNRISGRDFNAGRVTAWLRVSTQPTTIAPHLARCYPQSTVFAQDFDNTVRNIFWQEMGRAKNITGNKLLALQSFLVVLVKYLPTNEKTKTFLSEATAWVLQQTTILYVAQLTDFIKDIGKKIGFDLYPTPWIGCRGSEIKYRGYPCSLWVTFHTISVSHYLDYTKNPQIGHQTILSAIRHYVINYFSCRGCAEHFKNMSANFENEVTNIRESVLWLWWGHNKVNARVKGSPSDDPKNPKIQFPPVELCSNCPINNVPDVPWHVDNIFEFLVKHYSVNIVQTATCNKT